MELASKLGLSGPAVVAVLDLQWGDNGKGKYVDVFTHEWADVVARGTGGANAGHTIYSGSEKHVFNLLPSGILHDAAGKINVIGSGVAVDPRILCKELAGLRASGRTSNGLRIAYNAQLVLPQHVVMDRVFEAIAGQGKIGTTGRGIGPVYMDRVGRTGLVVNDLLNPGVFLRKLKRNLEDKVRVLKCIDPENVREVMAHEHLEHGAFYHESNIFDVDAIVSRYLEYASVFKDYITDTDTYLRGIVGKKRILLEGAQGILLSVDYGIHPHVTSSDCSLAGLARGVGLRTDQVDRTFAIAKAPYMTRVGEGVFPTEFGGETSAEWCGSKGATHEAEKVRHPVASINSVDEVTRGIAVRYAGNEYGATTGRPRRTGRLNLPFLRYALQFAGPRPEIILTKMDVFDECREIEICEHYIYTGPDYHVGDRCLKECSSIRVAIPDSDVLAHVNPVYSIFPGWQENLGDIRSMRKLPPKARDVALYVQQLLKTKVVAISVGPDREQTVVNDM